MKNFLKVLLFPIYKLIYQPYLILRDYRSDFLHLLGIWLSRKNSDHTEKSYVIFTVHKSASTGITKMLKNELIVKSFELCNVDQIFSLLVFSHDFWYRTLDRKDAKGSTVYGPIRQKRAFFLKDHVEAILLLRDPRDVLVSLFFSETKSHSLTNLKNIRKRLAQPSDIDEYVLSELENVKRTYSEYRVLLEEKQRQAVHLVRYEDMLEGPNLLAEILTPGLEIANPIRRQSTENSSQHLRSGRSRQFETALKAETITVLNDTLSTELAAFGYPL